ncbi:MULTISPECIES: 50S ribosomal protein L25/general stress protein Ctc [Leeuwenhoekiella]|uniref:Large ribosomal subunit protein bL25 n=2 Tax=Leeuwenhoekiella TaxID=283735 RepID=A0A2G1VW09_9FLAO|nr:MULTISPECIES: 50S ribosomal protein L25/general stress protein Ctc [Leeuwenhoekiella]MCC4211466.1 50S ribosomal protein L25/general stress protein Ctc [Leeuwenhoekiella parthenopeia]PHQ30967.1 50S ribosomal protein L25/general stress protein Ctc [Leeuwenhoekiella nanhaiensis]
MKSITITGSKRESVGKKATKALRNAGEVPCVLYGGDEPVHFNAPEIAFKDLVYTPDAHTATLELDGNTYMAILQDIQFHPVTDRILHIDFYQIFEGKEVAMTVPVHYEGNSRGVRNGGVLRKTYRTLRVKALPKDLPDYVTVNISDLKIGDKRSISEIEQGPWKYMHPEDTIVCQVRTSRNMVEDLEDEEEEGEEGETAAAEGETEEAKAEE